MAKVGRQGPLLPQTTASIDDIDHYERLSRLVFVLHDDNIAIGSLYCSGETSKLHQIYSAYFGFVEMDSIHSI